MNKKLVPFRLAPETIQKLDGLKAFFGFDDRTATIKTCINIVSRCSGLKWFSIGQQGANGQKNKQPTGIIVLYNNNFGAIQALLEQKLYSSEEFETFPVTGAAETAIKLLREKIPAAPAGQTSRGGLNGIF